MRNKILILIFSLVPCLSFAATRSPATAGRSDVNNAINGDTAHGGTDGNGGCPGQCSTAASDGDIIQIPSGTPAAWGSQITVTKNIQIHGAGIDQTVISGGWLWTLQPHAGVNQPRMILSDMTLNKTVVLGNINNSVIDISGICPINEANANLPATSGGLQLTKLLLTAAPSVIGTDPITQLPKVTTNYGNGYLIKWNGWIEGTMDHCIVDHDIQASGECLIINMNKSPDGTDGFGHTANYGFYAWNNPSPRGTIHQYYFEDNVLFRRGDVDDNQFPVGTSGGGMYGYRHNTSWSGNTGHSFGDAGNTFLGGRSIEQVKNLFINTVNEPSASWSGNQLDVRGGESLSFGNRWNRYGVGLSPAQSPLAVECNGISAGDVGDWFGTADGTNRWNDNWKGTIPVHGTFNAGLSFAPVSGYSNSYTNQYGETCTITNGVDACTGAGDVYAFGHGGTMVTRNTFTLTGMSSQPLNKWQDFVVINKSCTAGVANCPINIQAPVANQKPSAQNYAYLAGNDTSATTVFTKVISGLNDDKGPEWAITAGDDWEIRKVKRYQDSPGHGAGDTMIYNATNGTAGNRLVSGTPNPRYPNNEVNGLWEWDNRYVRTAGYTLTGGVPNPGTDTYTAVTLQIPDVNNNVTCGYTTGARGPDGSLMHENPGTTSGSAGTLYPSDYTYNGSQTAGAATGGTGGASGTELRPGTRVGADAVTWSYIQARGHLGRDAFQGTYPLSVLNAGGTVGSLTLVPENVYSFYTQGEGGFTYPHPFVKPSALVPSVAAPSLGFTVNGTDSCSGTISNCVHVTTSNFTTSPIVITLDAWVPTVANVNLTSTSGSGVGTIHGTAAGTTSGVHATVVHADTATEHASIPLSINFTTPNSAPTVSLTNPSDGQNFTVGIPITISADAQDDIGVVKVEFYDGATLLGTSNAAPYSVTTSSLALGSHTLTAKAYDASTNTTSASRTITVSTVVSTPPPSVIISSP